MGSKWVDADYDALLDIVEQDPNDKLKVSQVAAEIGKPEQSVCVALRHFRAYRSASRRAREPEVNRSSNEQLSPVNSSRNSCTPARLPPRLDVPADLFQNAHTPEDSPSRSKRRRDMFDIDGICGDVQASAERVIEGVRALHREVEQAHDVVIAKKIELKPAVENENMALKQYQTKCVGLRENMNSSGNGSGSGSVRGSANAND